MKECTYCGEVFHKPSKMLDKYWKLRRYCSRECAARGYGSKPVPVGLLLACGHRSGEMGLGHSPQRCVARLDAWFKSEEAVRV